MNRRHNAVYANAEETLHVYLIQTINFRSTQDSRHKMQNYISGAIGHERAYEKDRFAEGSFVLNYVENCQNCNSL